jgi:hypothetical protein
MSAIIIGMTKGLTLLQRLDLLLQRADAADARADDHADALGVGLADLQFGVLDRLVRRDDRELDHAVGAPGLLGRHPHGRVEALDLAGEGRLVTAPLGVEERDEIGTGLPGDRRLPVFGDIQAERRHRAQARHHHAPPLPVGLHTTSVD